MGHAAGVCAVHDGGAMPPMPRSPPRATSKMPASTAKTTGTGKPPGIATAFVAVSFAGSKRSSTAVEAGAGVEPSRRTPESYQLSTIVMRATVRDGTDGCTTSAELQAKRAAMRNSFIVNVNTRGEFTGAVVRLGGS